MNYLLPFRAFKTLAEERIEHRHGVDFDQNQSLNDNKRNPENKIENYRKLDEKGEEN